jgi:hypothetical protein
VIAIVRNRYNMPASTSIRSRPCFGRSSRGPRSRTCRTTRRWQLRSC